MVRFRRRALLCGGAALLVPSRAGAQQKPLPVLPLSIAVGTSEGAPVVSDAWLLGQLHDAFHLLSPHGIFVQLAHRRDLAAEHSMLENADDRDALAALIEPRVINVFVVASLRDVDDPRRMRMGVRWRQRRDVTKDYIIVSARAMSTTMTHELGHFFGNGHSYVTNNIMSYERDDPSEVAFDESQGRKMRQVAQRLLKSGVVAPLAELGSPRLK